MREQIIYIFSFENLYLKLTCHLPFTRKGFPIGCVRQGGRLHVQWLQAFLHSVPYMARWGFVYRP